MNKKKTIVLALLLVVIVVLTSCLLYACNPNVGSETEEEEIEATEGLLIQNGDFKVLSDSSSDYPRSASNWSGAKMYSSSSFRDDVIAGVISLDSALYGANKQAWDDDNDEIRQLLVKGGHGDENDENKNILMIYQPTTSKDNNDNDQHGPTAYGYTSASFTLSKGSYYKLSVDVLTHGLAGSVDEDGNAKPSNELGARIYVSSNTYAEFAGINTNDQWQTYEIYIETSPVSTTSLSVQLGLGKYTASYTDGLTTGYAFFDNLTLKKLVNAEENPDIKNDDIANEKVEGDPAQLFQTKYASETSDSTFTTTTLKVPNGRFDFGSFNVSSTGVPNSWTHVTGNSGKDDAAPTGLGYNAIIDTSKFADNYTKYASNYKAKTGPNATEGLYNPADVFKANGDSFFNAINDYDRVRNNVFMLSQQLMTAQGIRSSRTITIEKGKIYQLKISLFAASVRGAGASLILTGSDGKDIVIKGIASSPSSETYIGGRRLLDSANGYTAGEDSGSGYTSGEWTDYSFYIQGNDYKDFSYNLAIWLGTDGTSSNTSKTYRNLSQSSNSTTYTADGTFSTGWLFIDGLELNELTTMPGQDDNNKTIDQSNNFTLDVSEQRSATGAIVDLRQADNALANYLEATAGSTQPEVEPIGSGTPNGWTSNYDISDSDNPRVEGFVSEGVVNIASESDFAAVADKLGAYPQLPYAKMPNPKAFAIHASQDSYYEVESAPITVKANKFYRISFWLKTVDVKDTTGAYVYILNKTAQAEDEKGDEVVIDSITSINTDDYDEYLNDWVEINIVIRGGLKDDTDIALKFTLGTGKRWATTTLTTGTMYVANFNMADLTYANYTGTSTSTYTKTCNLASTTTWNFTNGSFDNYDLDDDNLKDDPDITHLYEQDMPASPESWTISDSTSANKTDSELYAGIIQLMDDDSRSQGDEDENFYFKSSHQAETATGIGADFFKNFYGDQATYFDQKQMSAIAGPNILAIGSKGAEKYAIGYSSTSFTLSANTYNKLTVYAKTYGETKATIFLTGEASGAGDNASSNAYKFNVEQSESWVKYVFFIEVGRNSVSLKLNLWLGDDIRYIADEEDPDYETKLQEQKSAGHVFFDNISSETLSDEDKFNEAIQKEKDDLSKVNQLSFQTDSFDPLSSSIESRRTLASANGWSGAAGTNQSSSNTKSGIIYTGNSNFYDNEEVGGTYYAKILGKDYTAENSDITVTQEDIAAYKAAHSEAINLDNYAVRELIINDRIEDLKVNNWIPVEYVAGRLKAHSGDHMLVINNTQKSAYTYTSSSNTLKANTYYKISIFMRTYGLNHKGNDDEFDELEVAQEELDAAKGEVAYAGMTDDEITSALLAKKEAELREKKEIGAYMELYLGSANETGNEFSFNHVANEEWTEYCFYVQTLDEDVTSVTIKLSLGKYITKDVDGKSVTYGLTTGYAMFDDISITEVDADEFTSISNALDPDSPDYDETKVGTNLTRTVSADESGTPSDSDSNTETPHSSFNLEYLWWMIPTIVLGLVIIAVLVVLVVRKVRSAAPKTVKIKKSPVSSSSAQSLDEKHDRYDSDKD